MFAIIAVVVIVAASTTVQSVNNNKAMRELEKLSEYERQLAMQVAEESERKTFIKETDKGTVAVFGFGIILLILILIILDKK